MCFLEMGSAQEGPACDHGQKGPEVLLLADHPRQWALVSPSLPGLSQ